MGLRTRRSIVSVLGVTAFVFALTLSGCGGGGEKNEVVLYCSLDQVFSETLIKEFEKQTGITVKAQYDQEATKTTGLVNRLIGEKDNPRCDVYWNNEIVLTVLLKNKGLLTPYVSSNAATIPATFKDQDGYWTGLAARSRVLIYNTNKIKKEDLPTSILDLTDPKWKDRFTIARPLAGTTRTHAAVLFEKLGKEKAEDYFRKLQASVGRGVDGNARVMRMVANGDYEFGLTDTDDANIARLNGDPVDITFLDSAPDQMGTLVIPNSVMMIKGGPNSENAKKLIDYILSNEVEEKLARGKSVQIPLHEGIVAPDEVVTLDEIHAMDIDFERVAEVIEPATEFLRDLFLK